MSSSFNFPVVVGTGTNDGTGDVLNIPVSIGNSTFVIVVGGTNAAAVLYKPTVSDDAGNIWNLITHEAGLHTGEALYWSIIDNTLINQNITIDCNDGPGQTTTGITGVVMTLAGVDPSEPEDSYSLSGPQYRQVSAGTGNTVQTSIKPNHTGSMFIWAIVNEDPTSVFTEDTGNGWITLVNQTGGNGCGITISYQINSGAGELEYQPSFAPLLERFFLTSCYKDPRTILMGSRCM